MSISIPMFSFSLATSLSVHLVTNGPSSLNFADEKVGFIIFLILFHFNLEADKR